MSYLDSDYAAAVWTAGTRTLHSGSAGSPSTPAEVWAAAIWAHTPRTLTTVSVSGGSAFRSTGRRVGPDPKRSAGKAT